MKKYIFINISMWFHQHEFGKYQLINQVLVRKLGIKVLNNWVLDRI